MPSLTPILRTNSAGCANSSRHRLPPPTLITRTLSLTYPHPDPNQVCDQHDPEYYPCPNPIPLTQAYNQVREELDAESDDEHFFI